MKKAKATALLFCLAAVQHSSAFRCYQCIYIKGVCGDDCRERPGDLYLSAHMNDSEVLTKLVTSSACNLSHAYGLGLGEEDAEMSTTSLPMSTSQPEPLLWYPYCEEQVLQSQFISAIVRGYSWQNSSDLDGNMTEGGKGAVIDITTYYCNTDRCNSNSLLPSGACTPGHGHAIFILTTFFLFHFILVKALSNM